MKRIPRPVLRTYGLVRKTGLAVLVVGILFAALFPGQIKKTIESWFAAPAKVAEPPEPSPPPQVETAQGAAGGAPSSPPPQPPPPPPAPRLPPGPPRVAVVGIGDDGVADRLGGLLVAALGREGLSHVQNGGRSLSVRDLVREFDGAPPASRVATVLREEGFSALVLAEGVEVGSRELSYYGRSETATKWRVEVSAYRLADLSDLGPGWSGEVESTERGAVASFESFFTRIASQVAPVVAQTLGGS